MHSLTTEESCEKCPYRPKSCFSNLSRPTLEALDSKRNKLSFREGEQLCERHGQGFFCIRVGAVRREIRYGANNKVVRLIGPGSLLQVDKSSDARTSFTSDGEACYFSKSDMLSLIDKVPLVAMGICEKLKNEVLSLERRMAGLENHTVKNRVASLLSELLDEFCKPSANGILIDTEIDRKSLALMAGTVSETLARVLTDFEEERILIRRGRKIFITDPQTLRKLSYGF